MCSPVLLAGRKSLNPKALAQMPLLQQSTRPEGWRQWFDAQGVAAPNALGGPRYELFSMLAVAATHHLGVALIPKLLIADELARGQLVVACPKGLHGQRSYYLVTPDVGQEPEVLTRFRRWVLQQAVVGI